MPLTFAVGVPVVGVALTFLPVLCTCEGAPTNTVDVTTIIVGILSIHAQTAGDRCCQLPCYFFVAEERALELVIVVTVTFRTSRQFRVGSRNENDASEEIAEERKGGGRSIRNTDGM